MEFVKFIGQDFNHLLGFIVVIGAIGSILVEISKNLGKRR